MHVRTSIEAGNGIHTELQTRITDIMITIASSRRQIRRFMVIQLAALVFIAGSLIANWASAKSPAASDATGTAQEPTECVATPAIGLGSTVQLDSDCTERPLANGRVGETVRECATVRYARVAYFLRVGKGNVRTPFVGYCAPASQPNSITYVSVVGG